MKRIKRLLLILLLVIPFTNLNAASCQNSNGTWKSGNVTLSSSSVSLTTGKSTKVTVKGPCAAGRISIKSSDTSIATVTPSSDFLDNSNTTLTIKAKKAGKVTISVELEDVAGYDEKKITGTKKITVTVKDPTTTTKAPTKATSKTTKKPTTKSTSKQTTQPTDPVIKEARIDTFNIVGYNINFDPNLLEYSIEVAANVDKLYIIVNGENFSVVGNGEVDIKDKDKVVVSLTSDTGTTNYTININRVGNTTTVPEIKEVVKEVVKTNNLYLYTTIALLVACIILAILLVKSKSKKNNTSYDTLIEEKKITPLQTTHISNTSSVNNMYTATSPVQPQNTTQTMTSNTLVNPIETMQLGPINNTNNQNTNNL